MAKPNHQHDCSNCQFIGNGTLNGDMCDWYICTAPGADKEERRLTDTLIARFGPEGKYASSLMWSNLYYNRLFQRALALGYKLDDVQKEIFLDCSFKHMKEQITSSRENMDFVLGKDEDSPKLGSADLLGVKDYL